MSLKKDKQKIRLSEGFYSFSITEIFEKFKNDIKPFIVIEIDNEDYLISNKKLFLKTIKKYKKSIARVLITKGLIVFFLKEKKVVKYILTDTDLKIANL